jgi:hypothetical protein
MHDYGEISRGSIRSMAVSGDGSNLFASDVFGSFKEFSIPQSCLLKEHTSTHVNGRLQETSAREYPTSGFNQILTSKGQLVTCENSGQVKLIPIIDHLVYKDHGKLFKGYMRSSFDSHLSESPISRPRSTQTFITIPRRPDNRQDQDSEKLYIFNSSSCLQYQIDEEKFSYQNKDKFDGEIICTCENSVSIFTSDTQRNLMHWSAESLELQKNYRSQGFQRIETMCCTPDNQFLFCSYNDGKDEGNVYQFDIISKKHLRTPPSLHNSAITVMACTWDSKYLIIAGHAGRLKQFSIISNGKYTLEIFKEYQSLVQGRVRC